MLSDSVFKTHKGIYTTALGYSETQLLNQLNELRHGIIENRVLEVGDTVLDILDNGTILLVLRDKQSTNFFNPYKYKLTMYVANRK